MKRGKEGQRERRQKRLSVALIDSRSLIRDALAHRLRTIRRGCHVLLFSSAADLINDIAAYENVDLILVSVHDESLAIVEQLSAVSNSKRIIIISDSDRADCIAAAIRQGARGYIPTNLNLPVAVAAVEVVLAGGTFVPASSMLLAPTPDPNELMQQPEPGPCGLEYSHSSPEKCIGETSGNSEPAGDSEFTTRELEVLASLAKGTSNKMIARELDMREGTVKVHVRSLLKKLNATNRTQLALRAYSALDNAQAVRRGHSTIPADPAADQGSTDTSSRSPETESTPAELIASLPNGKTLQLWSLTEDNLLSRSVGAKLLFLPKYSPDLNPIEQVFAKLKRLLRKAAARTVETVCSAIGQLLATSTPQECANYFINAGYALT